MENREPEFSWEQLSGTVKHSSETIIGSKPKNVNVNHKNDDFLQKLSEKQKNLRIAINTETNKSKKRELQIKRNHTMKQIKKMLKREQEAKELNEFMQELNTFRNDSTKFL